MFNDQLPFKFYVVHNSWYIFFFLFLIHIFVLLIVEKNRLPHR